MNGKVLYKLRIHKCFEKVDTSHSKEDLAVVVNAVNLPTQTKNLSIKFKPINDRETMFSKQTSWMGYG
jgi:hypothetical protein